MRTLRLGYAVYTCIYMDREMKLKVAKWGNGLAIRLPVECTRALGLHAGDRVEANVTPDGLLTLGHEHRFDKAAFLRRLSKLHAAMPMGKPVVARMRRENRY
jgi:antitoxin MazE